MKAKPTTTAALGPESLGHLNYLYSTLTRPLGEWEGFYRAQSASMNFALRYQIAFSVYALALMSTRTPAYRAPYTEAIRAAIEKMLHPDVWSYWRAPQEAGVTSSGHIAVLAGPHRRLPPGPPSDPIAQDNLQYSGHLSTMLGLYEKVSGDIRYDKPFTLRDEGSGATYTYTHSEVAARINAQMRENAFGGVCCEPGMAYVPCNNYAMGSNALHDALHGTRYSTVNAGWLETVRQKMLLRGPALRGVFGASYVKDLKIATPLAFNFTDAWGLAFMLPFDKGLVRKLYPKFRRKVERSEDGAYVGSSPLNERLEISDVPINTGFGLILARGVGDRRLASELELYARRELDAGWEGSRYYCRGVARTLHSTALYAFAEALDAGGANFTRLFTAPRDLAALNHPYLAEMLDPSGRVGVCRAEYDPEEHVLHIGLRQVGAPSELAAAPSIEVGLRVANIGVGARVEVNGQVTGTEVTGKEEVNVSFRVAVEPTEVTQCIIQT